jgi:hypothetical protein
MTNLVTLLIAGTVVTGLFLGVRYLACAYFRFRDSRIITCPETGEAAMVEVDAVHAALTSAVGQTHVRLQGCWRWPLNESCNQQCLTQLDVAEPECLVRGVLMKWYRSKACLYCGRPFQEIPLMSLSHKPALQSPDGKLLEWHEVPIEKIDSVLAHYLPVCWDCYVAQSFCHEHPELVSFRPWRGGVHRAG